MVDLDALRALIESERERFGVPGVAVAVVVDNEVALCEGFGTRDLASGEPVTAQTHFPIASDTKAFTAAALCLLADEGALDLDAPVREVIPWFEMADPHATALVTPRDLLSHRTGLPRHDLVWYGDSGLGLEDFVRALRHLPLSRQPRQSWQYNNLCFSTAGYLTEVLTGKDWPVAIAERLLTPLGMHATAFSVYDPAVTELALPYKDVEGTLSQQVLPDRNKVGPAGGIVSTASDMARWLQARLGRTDVLSADALAQLHGPAMIGGVAVAEFSERQPMGYALGCQVESYRGRRIVRHGGNLVGYSSDVCVVPGAGIGVVVLTNLHGTSLRDALPLAILDRLLGLDPVPWGERYHELMTASLAGRAAALTHHTAKAAGRAPSRPLEEFAGTYQHPAYGTLTITAADGRLVPDFHGLGDRARLDHRDRDSFDLFLVEFDQAVPLVFLQSNDGTISSLAVSLEPMVGPLTFTKVPPPVDPALLQAMVGEYRMGPHTLVIRRRGDSLFAKVPSAGTLALTAAGPNRFLAPAMPAVVVDVEVAPDGSVAKIVVDPLGVFEPAG